MFRSMYGCCAPVFSGCGAVHFFEAAVEIGEAVETGFHGDLQNGIRGVPQTLGGFLQAVAVEVLDEAGAHGVLEKFHEIGLAVKACAGDLGDGDGAAVVVRNVGQNLLDLGEGFSVEGVLRFRALGGDDLVEHLEQAALYRQRIAVRSGITESIDAFQQNGDGGIVPALRCQHRCDLLRFRKERLEKTGIAGVIFRCQKLRTEQDGFVFHDGAALLCNGVELSGQHQYDIAGSDGVAL